MVCKNQQKRGLNRFRQVVAANGGFIPQVPTRTYYKKEKVMAKDSVQESSVAQNLGKKLGEYFEQTKRVLAIVEKAKETTIKTAKKSGAFWEELKKGWKEGREASRVSQKN